MKKFLASVVSGLFVLGTAASSFAIQAEIPSETQAAVAKGGTQITLGGEIRVRGEYIGNPNTDNDNEHKSGYDERVRLSLEAKVTPNTTGFVELESGTNGSGILDNGDDDFHWGEESNAHGYWTEGNSKRGALSIRQAWILHTGSGLLGTPAGVKVGHMPLALGNKLFFDHSLYGDDAIVFFVDPTKEVHIAALTFKAREGSLNISDDADGYVGLITYTPEKDMCFSFDATYVDDQGSVPVHLWNFGLRGNMDNISGSGFGLMADVELQTGEAEYSKTYSTPDMDVSGWAAMVGANYKIDPVTLSLTFAYGSGDENSSDDDFETFITTLSDTQYYTYVYGYRVKAATGMKHSGISNTTYLKLGADAELAKDLTGNFGLYWLKASEDVSLNGGPLDDDLGWELDAKLTYQIDRNLKYWVEGGYFWMGDAYKYSPSEDADNAYAIRHGIQLNF